jgi:hypothetical protein
MELIKVFIAGWVVGWAVLAIASIFQGTSRYGRSQRVVIPPPPRMPHGNFHVKEPVDSSKDTVLPPPPGKKSAQWPIVDTSTKV